MEQEQSLKELAVKISYLRNFEFTGVTPLEILECLGLIYNHLKQNIVGQEAIMKLLQNEGIL